MNIISYIHPVSTYVPCTGIGKHINQILLGLNHRDEISLKLLFSQQWLQQKQLNPLSPLSPLPFITFPAAENATERNWKLWGFPRMDRYIADDTDWLYAPMQTYIPVTKCPVAVTLHDIQAFEPNLPWSKTWQHRWFAYKWGQWVRKALTDCRVVFTVSEFSKQRMVDLLGADPRKIEVIGNGVDPSFFEIATIDPASLDRPHESPYIIIVGGLRQKKGADDVLAVAKLLQNQNSDLQIVVAGASEDLYIAAARDYDNITLLGMVSDRDLPRLLRCASSLLFLSPYEGFGIPALEAMAAGIPSVVSNRASLPEIVGDAGLIVEPTATAAVVELLVELDRNSQFRAEYIHRGHQHAAIYTWSSCVDRLVTAFNTFA
ncbi:glycosyltransferase family 4 protein [Chamaesiphon polymorphus]|uniref:Glycosyltransferase family 1 protein n=1 Tax=Chamaesiphon polymorphus CCALA 037 TaxID=2107692 RepID=A0A2T1GMA3_9CYAN|nr:glycosyltransferase family 1 protein [Chamaesiphon polymorphus]PSB59032.1 glycosyltransferase family 1 protein [Chamaesiphon polymorphus CCALA 037]